MSTIYCDESKKLLDIILKENDFYKNRKKEIKNILDTEIKVVSPFTGTFKEPIVSFMNDAEIEIHSGAFFKTWYSILSLEFDGEYSFEDFLKDMFIDDFNPNKIYIIGCTTDTHIASEVEDFTIKSFISSINYINEYCDSDIRLEELGATLKFDEEYNIPNANIDLFEDGEFIATSLEIINACTVKYKGAYIPNPSIFDEELISGVFDKEDIIYEEGERKIYTSLFAEVKKDDLEECILNNDLAGIINIGWEYWSF